MKTGEGGERRDRRSREKKRVEGKREMGKRERRAGKGKGKVEGNGREERRWRGIDHVLRLNKPLPPLFFCHEKFS